MVLGGLKIPRIVPFTGSTHGFGTHMAFDNSYARLPERFFARLAPTPVPAPRLIRLNDDLARHLGIDPDRLAAPGRGGGVGGERVPPPLPPPPRAGSRDEEATPETPPNKENAFRPFF